MNEATLETSNQRPRIGARLDAEALDFSPDLLAIQERPATRAPRAVAHLLVGLLGLLIVWSFAAHRDVIAVAQGRLVPLSLTKTVQTAEGGVVAEILVRDGDVVSRGQTLVRLDPRAAAADVLALAKEAALRRLILMHIGHELDGGRVVGAVVIDEVLRRQVESQFAARRRAHDDSVSQELKSIERTKSELKAARQVQSKLEASLTSFRLSAEASRKLVAEGFLGEVAAAERLRELADREGDVRAQIAVVEGLQFAVAQSVQKLATLQSQFRSQLENEKIETVAMLNRAEHELQKAELKSKLLDVQSPTNGVVKDLVLTSKGAVVAAGAELMAIVPISEALQVEASLSNEDVGFTNVGQPVTIKVGAYPFQRFGTLQGRVALVAADTSDPKRTPPGEQHAMVYRALIDLLEGEWKSPANGDRLRLSPGMLVTAEIHQGKRSIIEYLLSPIRKVSHEAARER